MVCEKCQGSGFHVDELIIETCIECEGSGLNPAFRQAEHSRMVSIQTALNAVYDALKK